MEQRMLPMEPFATQLVPALSVRGAVTLDPADHVIRRYLSDVRHIYVDADAVDHILRTEGDRLVYEVRYAAVPEEEGQVPYCTTIIFPGRVGDEFHMTRGHFHVRRDRAEVYLGLAGEALLLLQTEAGDVRTLPLRSGTVAYVPPFWGHRTINVGDEPVAFLAAWPGDAGHDYEAFDRLGFTRLLVARDGQVVLIDNPKRR